MTGDPVVVWAIGMVAILAVAVACITAAGWYADRRDRRRR